MTFVITTFIFGNNGKNRSPTSNRDSAKNSIYNMDNLHLASFVVLSLDLDHFIR